jgi:mRNA-degrading endonuclease RelE of RelBE toxin-antitoxin system
MSTAANWVVNFTNKAAKQFAKLPEKVREQVSLLALEIEKEGPVRGNWANYSKLTGNRHHCHVKKGKPTYVVCWEVTEKTAKIVEVYYAGTHEKAPY